MAAAVLVLCVDRLFRSAPPGALFALYVALLTGFGRFYLENLRVDPSKELPVCG